MMQPAHEHDAKTPAAPQASSPPPAPDTAAAFLADRLPLMTRYVDALCDTGVSHGLMGPREVPRMWERHVLNCAVVHPGIARGAHVADIGAGAGLPGLVLAIARPDLTMTLVEPLLRRTTWLADVVNELDLPNVEVVRARADELWGQRTFDVVTSRAVARIGELARWSLPLVSRGGEMFVLKGSSAAEERDEDEAVLRRLRVRTSEVETWGEGTVEPPTVTVRLTVDGIAPQLTRKQAGTIDKTKQKPSRRPDRRA
ncbi:16S rRNA (guanine(527)-N(7))-methyltransferase RsmG [Dermacoccus nishinomiyaensis]|uniref:16S rRNA (guanine(527)-N(7))-methyltransferase RsmG n=1 Tax=Dermacoccus nishinomiyaensis TaxID=1274 RepID=UPI001F507B5D|nr:16S rRNA (guanine(527)-N(7))-methyltransferase RsmG [Dermacoccus nishinomiyaensis]MCI0154071.1 16S rRNA (guanine(527)-N(7))-methyltransferase RsmG [Dermacoccus nishinomiyaensis]